MNKVSSWLLALPTLWVGVGGVDSSNPYGHQGSPLPHTWAGSARQRHPRAPANNSPLPEAQSWWQMPFWLYLFSVRGGEF